MNLSCVTPEFFITLLGIKAYVPFGKNTSNRMAVSNKIMPCTESAIGAV